LSAEEYNKADQRLLTANGFFVATLDLLNDEISGSQWLGKLGEIAECESVSCIWWPVGQPEEFIKDFYGPDIDFPVDWIQRLEIFLTKLDLQKPTLIDPFAQGDGGFIDNPKSPLFKPERLVACVDWFPSRVILVWEGIETTPVWREQASYWSDVFLPIIRKSVITKKRLSTYSDSLHLANKVFDCLPRGILTMLPDCTILNRNKKAEQLLADDAEIKINGNKLIIVDRAIKRELNEQLLKVQNLPEDKLTEYGWYKSIKNATGEFSLFLTMRALKHDVWRIESSVYKRAVVITLASDELSSPPGEEKLREFYGLTRMQARFTNELIRFGSIEEASKALNISINTARSHLRAIYTKIGVGSLPQLFRAISQSLTAYAYEDGQ
jgi:hypothetical protein